MLIVFGAIALSINFAGLIVLSDISQIMGAVFPRSAFYFLINRRYVLMGISAIAFAISLAFGVATDVSLATLVVYSAVYAFTLFAGYWMAPLLIFPSQQHNARFASIADVRSHLSDEDEVMVVVNNGEACAYPTNWTIRPHVVGTTLGNENITMTYCGLSHLAMPFKGNNFNLMAMAQTESNLILIDTVGNDPIQHIYGKKVQSGESPDRLSSVFMSFGAYSRLYPDGKVFFNPARNLFDKLLTKALNTLVYTQQYNPDTADFAFPNVKHHDNRVPRKEFVYGVEINNEAVAYRLEDVRNAGAIVDTIGGETITVKYFPEYDYVDMFRGDMPDATPFDHDAQLPHANRVLWGVWANFHRQTGVGVNATKSAEVATG